MEFGPRRSPSGGTIVHRFPRPPARSGWPPFPTRPAPGPDGLAPECPGPRTRSARLREAFDRSPSFRSRLVMSNSRGRRTGGYRRPCYLFGPAGVGGTGRGPKLTTAVADSLLLIRDTLGYGPRNRLFNSGCALEIRGCMGCRGVDSRSLDFTFSLRRTIAGAPRRTPPSTRLCCRSQWTVSASVKDCAGFP